MSQFQVKWSDEDDWIEVSESIVLEKLVHEFGRVTPFIAQMLQSKEIVTPHGIFRMKNVGNE